MVVLRNVISQIINDFKSYYNNLTDETKLIFYIIVILVFIVLLLILIILDQRSKSNKNESASKLDNNLLLNTENLSEQDIDVENEKTQNLKEITDKLQAVIDNQNIDFTDFEKEQEENSIISYQELKNAVGSTNNENEQEKFELPNLIKKIEVDEIIEHEEKPEIETMEKFKKSEIISPIFGIQNEPNNIEYKYRKPIKEKVKKEEEIEMLFPDEQVGLKPNINEDDNKINEEHFLNELKKLRNDLN